MINKRMNIFLKSITIQNSQTYPSLTEDHASICKRKYVKAKLSKYKITVT